MPDERKPQPTDASRKPVAAKPLERKPAPKGRPAWPPRQADDD